MAFLAYGAEGPKLNKFRKASLYTGLFALAANILAGAAMPASALTATVNAVSFKAPVFDSYNHATGGGVWNDGSVTYDKGELLGTNYRCGDIATFLLELNTSATPTKQPAPYKAQISINYTWDSTGATGASLTALSSADHLKTNTGVIRNAAGTIIGGATGTSPAGVTAGWDSGFNAAGTTAAVATSPAPVVTNTGAAYVNGASTPAGSEFGGNTSTSNVTFVVENLAAGANVVVRSDAVIHCKPNSSPTGNMQAALASVNIIYPGAPEAISAGNQTVNFRGVGNLAGLGAGLSITKSIANPDCSSTISTKTLSIAGPVTYCYTITNTGSSDATSVLVKDDKGTPAAPGDDITLQLLSSVNGTPLSTQTVIPANTTVYAQTTYTVSATQTNTVTATASNATTAIATAKVTVGSAPTLSITKTQTSGNPSAVGDIITYQISVTDWSGNSSGVDIADANASSLTCGATTDNVAPIAISNVNPVGTNPGLITCTATHIVTTGDVNLGYVNNVATASKSSSNATSNTVTTPIVVRPTTYDMSITKTQTSTQRPKAAGDVITYAIQVTNIGTGSITGVSLADNLAGATLGSCNYVAAGNPSVSLPIATFAAGASFICSASYVVQLSDVNTTVTNNATVAGTGGSTPLSFVSNNVTTQIAAIPSLTVQKIQATGSNANTGQYPSAVGQVLTYGIGVTNTGNVNLTNVVVTDPNADLGSLVCASPFEAAPVGGVSLSAGQNISCTASHTVTAADLTSGTITNIAYASGSTGTGTVSGQSSNVVTTAALRIVKSLADGFTLTGSETAGANILYKIVVTNTGSVTLTGIAVADPNATNISCPTSTLTAGQSMTCTANHVATSTEANAHQTVNTASVTTTQIAGAIYSNTVTTPLVAPLNPHVSIVKTRTSASPVNQGEVINYTLTITNDGVGSVNVTGVTDANASTPNCTVTFPTTLTDGQSFTCSVSHTVSAADMIAGNVTNTAVVAATAVVGGGSLNANSNTVTDPLTFTHGLTIVKSYTGSAPTIAGDVVHYNFVVTNTGTVNLTNVGVSDLIVPSVICPRLTLLPSASMTCDGSYTVTSTDVTNGSVINTATVSGLDPNGGSVSATSNTITLPLTAPSTSAPYSPRASLQIVKAITGTLPTKVGDSITFSIVVTNNGDLSLTGVRVTDANATIGTCSVSMPATLAVGASITCSATHLVTDADFKAGRVENIAAATSSTGSLSTSSNVVSVPLTPVAGISIVKTLNGPAPFKVGDVVTYKIVVANTGNVTLTAATVTDANAVLGVCAPTSPATLAPAATITCAATHVVTAADMVAGKVDNIAMVTATSVAGGIVGSGSGSGSGSASSPNNSADPTIAATSSVVTVPLNPGPKLAILKKQSGALPTGVGGYINYVITVTNIGNVVLHAVTIRDENATLFNCSDSNPTSVLEIGASITCSAKHELTDADVLAGKVINIASVKSAENARADSGTNSGTPQPSNATPGSVVVPSNEVITVIKVAGARVKGVVPSKPNGGTVRLGSKALANPKLKVLAFTGDIDEVRNDASIFLLSLTAIAALAFIRRRKMKH